jgi:glycosyltransferase involved in cell wall biosynthesis
MVDYADIMIVTYNRLELTKRTLEDLLNTTDFFFNLIIVDNGSQDKTVEYLQKFCLDNSHKGFFKDYIIKENKENLGIAIGRNQCLSLSKENWLVTFDNDVLVPKGWLTECVDILKINRQYACIGVNFEGKNYPAVKLNGKEFQDKPRGNLGTACMVFQRYLHKILGYFNYLDYGKYGLEDSDFGARISFALKMKLGYLSSPGVHIGSGSYDVGPYRAYKTAEHDKYLHKFNENCRLYCNKQKQLYIPFKDIY